MMYNNPAPLARSSRIWPQELSAADATTDGPISVLRAMSASVLEHKFKLIFCAVLGLLVAFIYAHSLPQLYTATATLLLEPRRQATASGSEVTASQGLDINRADSELQVIRSERLLTAVFDSLDLQNSDELGAPKPGFVDRILTDVENFVGVGAQGAQRSAASLAEEKRHIAFANFSQRLTARRVGQSYVIEVEYASTNPALAVRVANSAVSAYILQSVAYKADIAKAGGEFLQGRIDGLAIQVATATEAMKQGTLPQVPTPDADGRVIGAAQLPLSPSSPRTKLIIAFGGVSGLIAGIALLGGAIIFDRKVRTPKTLMRQTGVPCLGTLPDVGNWKGKSRYLKGKAISLVSAKPRSAFTNAIRDLQTAIDITTPTFRNGKGVAIAVAAWKPATGVSTLCMNLAQVMCRNGRHVTVFTATRLDDGDRNSPRVHTQVPAALLEALVTETIPDLIADSNVDGVAVLPIFSSDKLLDRALDFRDPRIKHIIDAALSVGDVLLDLPALSSSADGMALAQLSDAVIVTARAGSTTYDDVSDAIDQLLRVGTNVIGTVINRAAA